MHPCGPQLLKRGTAFLAVLVLFAAGCSSVPSDQTALTPEQIEIRNLRSSAEVLKNALATMAQERDQYKDRFLTADTELRTRGATMEFLESQQRAQLQAQETARSKVEESSRTILDLRGELQKKTEAFSTSEQTVTELREKLSTRGNEVDTLTEKLQQTQSALTASEKELKLLNEQREALTKNSTSAQALAEQVATLEARVETLTGERDEARARVESMAANAGQAKPVFTATPNQAQGEVPPGVAATQRYTRSATEKSAAVFVAGWFQQTVNEVRLGQFSEDGKLLIAFVGTAAILLLLVLYFMLRAGGVRRRLKKLTRESSPVEASLPPAAESMRHDLPRTASAVAAVNAEAEQLAATMRIPDSAAPKVVGGSPTNVASPPADDPASAVTMAIPRAQDSVLGGAQISEHLDQALPDDGVSTNDPDTVMIEPLDLTAPVEAAPAEDEALLADLKSAIQDKFAELRKGP